LGGLVGALLACAVGEAVAVVVDAVAAVLRGAAAGHHDREVARHVLVAVDHDRVAGAGRRREGDLLDLGVHVLALGQAGVGVTGAAVFEDEEVQVGGEVQGGSRRPLRPPGPVWPALDADGCVGGESQCAVVTSRYRRRYTPVSNLTIC
jgi:hypothetical protein